MAISYPQKQKKIKQYLAIRNLYAEGNVSTRDLAKLVHKTPQWVWWVITGKGIKLLEELNLPNLIKDPRVRKSVGKNK